MRNKRFQFALVQHPMLLLVHEDRGEPAIAERIPPWGAPDTEAYVDRLRRNLDALRRYPDLRLNYEFSGLELEILAENAPDIFPLMREMVQEGRLAFVGGDYAQPHGQLFSDELNFRQLEHGLSVIRDLTGYIVRNNFHQETCLHDQLPQLLRAFGFQTASPPTFTHNITPVSAAEPAGSGQERRGRIYSPGGRQCRFLARLGRNRDTGRDLGHFARVRPRPQARSPGSIQRAVSFLADIFWRRRTWRRSSRNAMSSCSAWASRSCSTGR